MMTGDQDFIKYVRARALNLGLHLDEFGLWKWRSVESAESTEEQPTPAATEGQDPENTGGYWELLKVSTEEDIFSLLDMEYVEPHRRNFGYLKTAKGR
jgi:DNA polymerase beta